MPCDHPLVKCAECGEYVEEREWARNGKPTAKPDLPSETLTDRLAALFLAGEVLQFCSQECLERHQGED